MKLGLVIKITNGGVAEAMSINKDESWARYIPNDVRLEINVLDNYDGTEKTVYLAKFLGSAGYLVALIKSAPKGSTNWRNWDNTTAWLYVPATCDISNSEIISVLQNVETAISASKGIDTELLYQIFDNNYNTNDVLLSASGAIVSNNDADYGVRYYNKDYTLKELLGISIAQQEYSNYKGIFFIDANDGITSSCKELNFEPKKICQFLPPSPKDGFAPYFLLKDKYQSFNKAIEVPEGGQVTIYWVKKGYAVIKKSFVAKDGPTCPNAALISPNEYKIIVKRSHFQIYDPNSIPVKNPDISINGIPMTGDSLEIPESSYNEGVRLLIRVKGLADYRNEKEKLSKNMQIVMGHHYYRYDFEIPLQGEEEQLSPALFSIETRHKLKHCPIQGYETDNFSVSESNRGVVNRLHVNGNLKLKVKFFLYGVASVIVASLLYTGCQALENYEFQLGWPPLTKKQQKAADKPDNSKTDENTDSGLSTEENGKVSLDSAIIYLDNSEEWCKDSLEKYEATRGLFDALNDFDYQKMFDCYNNKLNQSSNKLKEIIDAFEVNNQNGWDPQRGKEAHEGKYNSPDDNKIVVKNYIKWLSNDHSDSKPPTNGTHGSKITGKSESLHGGQNPSGGTSKNDQESLRGGVE